MLRGAKSESLRRLRDILFGVYWTSRRWRSISFAQYSEDVLLRAFYPTSKGLYVDVGAYHPSILSNTYKLYLRGWRGLTIEPNPDAARLFRMMRPRDTHIIAGVSASRSELKYYKFKDSNMNTFDPERAGTHSEVTTVECYPLQELIQRYCPGRRVDLLSVDCEGFDLEVLRTLNWEVSRPTVVIVEDFEQFRIQASGHGQGAIQRFLTSRGYAMVAQGLFSFFYVDLSRFGSDGRDGGFDLKGSQLAWLAST
jgi:FkbM family methyltransferase